MSQTNAPEPTNRATGKPSGWRRLRFPHSWAEVKQLGWKMIAAFVLFYLVRDAILYILLPYLAYKGIVD